MIAEESGVGIDHALTLRALRYADCLFNAGTNSFAFQHRLHQCIAFRCHHVFRFFTLGGYSESQRIRTSTLRYFHEPPDGYTFAGMVSGRRHSSLKTIMPQSSRYAAPVRPIFRQMARYNQSNLQPQGAIGSPFDMDSIIDHKRRPGAQPAVYYCQKIRFEKTTSRSIIAMH